MVVLSQQITLTMALVIMLAGIILFQKAKDDDDLGER